MSSPPDGGLHSGGHRPSQELQMGKLNGRLGDACRRRVYQSLDPVKQYNTAAGRAVDQPRRVAHTPQRRLICQDLECKPGLTITGQVGGGGEIETNW